MLVKCENALLLSEVASFSNTYRQLADEADVNLITEKDWSDKYRVKEEVVILGSKYLSKLNKIYYPNAVLILKSSETPFPFVKEGITRFIFDHTNKKELSMAFFKAEPVRISASNSTLEDIIKESDILSFCQGNYDFEFDKDKYFYKGKPIYLAPAQKRYLAEWLLNGKKDNSKRMQLCILRKKFGNDFLKEIDRYGEIKEEKDE